MRAATLLVLVVTAVAVTRPALSQPAGLSAATAPLLAQLNRTKQALEAKKEAAALVAAAEITSVAPRVGGAGGLAARAAAGVASLATGRRAVVVFLGGGTPHPYTGPRNAPSERCDAPREAFVEALLAAGLPVFTAPAFTSLLSSTSAETGCPPQPPLDAQWDANGWPAQAGDAGLNFLGWLAATRGYRTFDLVGYSYGGVVGRATISALKAAKAGLWEGGGGGGNGTNPDAPGFSYGAYAAAVRISIPTLLTMNSPHLGSPAYDIVQAPLTAFAPVAASWGLEYAELALPLIVAGFFNSGALEFLVTAGHTAEAFRTGKSWESSQVGALDGVALTLVAGDYCGTDGCGGSRSTSPRSDGTVALYSQLLQECNPPQCGPPPTSVYVPPGLLPAAGNVVRKVFPTVHSVLVPYTLAALNGTTTLPFPETFSVVNNPEAIAYIVETVVAGWRSAGVPVGGVLG